MPPPGIEPGTFRSSVWRSPNWAIAAPSHAPSKPNRWMSHVTCFKMIKKKVLQEGLEPPTLGLLDPCSTNWATRADIRFRAWSAFHFDTTTRNTDKQKLQCKRGHVGIEPTTSPTLKENHTTRPMAHGNPWSLEWIIYYVCDHKQQQKNHPFCISDYQNSSKRQNFRLLGVGFEPTPPERIELESTALDHSAIQARCKPFFRSHASKTVI